MRRAFLLALALGAGAFGACHWVPHTRLSERLLPVPTRVLARPPAWSPQDGLPLDAEPLGLLADGDVEERVPVSLDEVPRHLVDAVLVAEDRRFRWHPGVDPLRLGAALLENLRAGRITEGGSTLTQQLVKNVYLSPERTLARKLREMTIAVGLELRYSKDEILEAYLDQVYLGQRGDRAIHGVGRAARFFFGKEVAELDVAEAALLAALIRAPSALSPFRHPERARRSRDRVLDGMLEHGRIDAATHATARAAALGVRREAPRPRLAGHFRAAVRSDLEARLGPDVGDAGLRVVTTLDPDLQRAAESAVSVGLRRLERGHRLLRRPGAPLQAALVALDPRSGEVRAYVGGRDFESAPFDRAGRARRQPGSLFKPVVALAAFAAEVRPRLTLASILEDAALQLEVEGEAWRPANHDGRFRGPVTLRDALEQSLNVPFARLGLEAGLVHVAETARRLGVASPLRPVPSLSLGSFETTPLEIAGVYATLATGGVRRPTRLVLARVTPEGRVEAEDPGRTRRVADARRVHLVTSALQGAVRRGTARDLRRLGVGGHWAAKTGTTNDFRDGWFVAYGPELVVVVWVGFDDGARVGLTGARSALPIAARFLRAAGVEASAFPEPHGLARVEVDPRSGLRCTGRVELFEAGTAPRGRCGGWRHGLSRVLGVLRAD